jgi:uncharacterized membrane protein
VPRVSSNRRVPGIEEEQQGDRMMKEGTYIQYLIGAAIVGALLYITPSYGVLLLVSSIIVMAFALIVALLAGGMYVCEQSLNEFKNLSQEPKPVNIRHTVPGNR